jgi:uncharacterized protein YecE (DUF72 family)
MPSEIRIGTSGYSYKQWAGLYYPGHLKPSEWLRYYAKDFDTVELNNTFYNLPAAETFDNWRKATPHDFVYSVKGSRFITHMIKLKDPERGLVNFVPRAERLRRKLGPILWQLPPGWKVNEERLETFLQMLPRGHRYTFELRNTTWMSDRVYAILRKYNAAFCVYQIGGYASPRQITADWTYVRLHGPTALKYKGSYSAEQLGEWAEQIRSWSRTLKAIYVYFDNDDSAFAVRNALALKKLLKLDRRRSRTAAADVSRDDRRRSEEGTERG